MNEAINTTHEHEKLLAEAAVHLHQHCECQNEDDECVPCEITGEAAFTLDQIRYLKAQVLDVLEQCHETMRLIEASTRIRAAYCTTCEHINCHAHDSNQTTQSGEE